MESGDGVGDERRRRRRGVDFPAALRCEAPMRSPAPGARIGGRRYDHAPATVTSSTEHSDSGSSSTIATGSRPTSPRISAARTPRRRRSSSCPLRSRRASSRRSVFARRKGWELDEIGADVTLDPRCRHKCTIAVRLPGGPERRPDAPARGRRACAVHRTLELGIAFEHGCRRPGLILRRHCGAPVHGCTGDRERLQRQSVQWAAPRQGALDRLQRIVSPLWKSLFGAAAGRSSAARIRR